MDLPGRARSLPCNPKYRLRIFPDPLSPCRAHFRRHLPLSTRVQQGSCISEQMEAEPGEGLTVRAHGEVTLVHPQTYGGKARLVFDFVFFFSIISLVTDHIAVCAVSGVSVSAPARPARGRDSCPRSAAAWTSQGPHRPSGTALACCFTRCDQDVAISPRERVPSGPPTRSPQGSAGQDCPGHPGPRHSGEQPPTHAAVSLPGGLHLLATRDFYLLNPRLTGWQK